MPAPIEQGKFGIARGDLRERPGKRRADLFLADARHDRDDLFDLYAMQLCGNGGKVCGLTANSRYSQLAATSRLSCVQSTPSSSNRSSASREGSATITFFARINSERTAPCKMARAIKPPPITPSLLLLFHKASFFTHKDEKID